MKKLVLLNSDQIDRICKVLGDSDPKTIAELNNSCLVSIQFISDEYGEATVIVNSPAVDILKSIADTLTTTDSQFHVIVKNETDEMEKHCPYCKEWASYFSDRDSDVYCPDCGRLISKGEILVH